MSTITINGIPIIVNGQLNYAHIFGINSVVAPVVFAVAYIPLLLWFIRQSIKIPTYVHYVLVFFCLLRVTAFVIRALLAGSKTLGTNLGLFVADQVLISVGFFGLLYSAYILVLNRRDLLFSRSSSKEPTNNKFVRIISNRRAFRIVLLVGVALGVVAASRTNFDSVSSIQLSNDLRKASVAVFLVLTVLQAFLTIVLTRDETRMGPAHTSDLLDSYGGARIGSKHGHWVLLLVSGLLLVREAYAVATVNTLFVHERAWYPLTALPEVLAVALYATPGLVPRA